VLTLVFDLNAEYLNLTKADGYTPNRYADRMITFTPYLAEETDFERTLTIPVHELSTLLGLFTELNLPPQSNIGRKLCLSISKTQRDSDYLAQEALITLR
jgi:hypothetical protein